MTIRRIAKSAALLILVMPVMAAQTQGPASGPGPLDDGLARAFRYRAIGPARQCGRILHVAAHPSEPFTFYISPGTGGLWRTTNNGTTFESLLPEESNVPVGHFAIAPSDPRVPFVIPSGPSVKSQGARPPTFRPREMRSLLTVPPARAQPAQHIPGVDPISMSVGPDRQEGVVPDGFERHELTGRSLDGA